MTFPELFTTRRPNRARNLIIHFLAVAILSAVSFADTTAYGAVMVFTDRTDWENAIKAIDPLAVFDGEDWNLEAVSYIPGTNNGLDNGPHSYAGGFLELTLNDIGGPIGFNPNAGPEDGGSQSGVVSGGDFDATNALDLRLVEDSSDFELFPGFPLDGEGVEEAVFSFSSSILGFGAEFTSVNNQGDGVDITVNGMVVWTLDPTDGLPLDPLNRGDGFLGWVDSAGFSSFSMRVADNPNDPSSPSTFEGFQMEDTGWATSTNGGTPPGPGGAIPEPSSVIVWLGLGIIGVTSRRFAGGRGRRSDQDRSS